MYIPHTSPGARRSYIPNARCQCLNVSWTRIRIINSRSARATYCRHSPKDIYRQLLLSLLKLCICAVPIHISHNVLSLLTGKDNPGLCRNEHVVTVRVAAKESHIIGRYFYSVRSLALYRVALGAVGIEIFAVILRVVCGHVRFCYQHPRGTSVATTSGVKELRPVRVIAQQTGVSHTRRFRVVHPGVFGLVAQVPARIEPRLHRAIGGGNSRHLPQGWQRWRGSPALTYLVCQPPYSQFVPGSFSVQGEFLDDHGSAVVRCVPHLSSRGWSGCRTLITGCLTDQGP